MSRACRFAVLCTLDASLCTVQFLCRSKAHIAPLGWLSILLALCLPFSCGCRFDRRAMMPDERAPTAAAAGVEQGKIAAAKMGFPQKSHPHKINRIVARKGVLQGGCRGGGVGETKPPQDRRQGGEREGERRGERTRTSLCRKGADAQERPPKVAAAQRAANEKRARPARCDLLSRTYVRLNRYFFVFSFGKMPLVENLFPVFPLCFWYCFRFDIL